MGVGTQERGDTIWVSAASHDVNLLDLDEVLLSSTMDSISKSELENTQKQDSDIGRVVTFYRTGKWSSSWESKRELLATRVLLR